MAQDDDDDDDAQDGETDHGVPFPGEAVPPERRTQAKVDLPRGERIDWAKVFGRVAPRVVDLGCGNGRFLLASALRRPDFDHLGVDIVPQSIDHAARRAGERGLTNLKVAWKDGLDLLFQGLEPKSVRELHVYHPQPYYEARDLHKRMLTPAFFGRAWRVLEPEGLLVLQTDNPYYWQYVSHCAPRLFRWRERKEPWSDAPEGRSRREIFARSRGLEIFRGTGKPRQTTPHRARLIVKHLPPASFDANRPRFRRPEPEQDEQDADV